MSCNFLMDTRVLRQSRQHLDPMLPLHKTGHQHQSVMSTSSFCQVLRCDFCHPPSWYQLKFFYIKRTSSRVQWDGLGLISGLIRRVLENLQLLQR
jgi:hypothetical protein